jgi:hypothetical protein
MLVEKHKEKKKYLPERSSVVIFSWIPNKEASLIHDNIFSMDVAMISKFRN